MTDDDQRYADLFKGKPGTVLGSFNEPPIETRAGFVSAKKKLSQKNDYRRAAITAVACLPAKMLSTHGRSWI
ncbi:hypothetical protein N8000_00235 [Rhodospirillales bacterium]|nr:hypothetical protein [Rhodospirillales bacterium]